MSFNTFALAVVGLTLVQFVLNWAGYQNERNLYWWGEPLTFQGAVARLPRDFAVAVITTSVYAAISGVRSNHQDSTN